MPFRKLRQIRPSNSDNGQAWAVKKMVLHWYCIEIPSRSFYSHTDGYPQAFRKEVLMTKSL